MARPLRIEFASVLYHITARGNAREDIYLDDEDRTSFYPSSIRRVAVTIGTATPTV